jgi:hypothetical protein
VRGFSEGNSDVANTQLPLFNHKISIILTHCCNTYSNFLILLKKLPYFPNRFTIPEPFEKPMAYALDVSINGLQSFFISNSIGDIPSISDNFLKVF